MGGENDGAFLAFGDDVRDDFPHESARHGVHARARLVQKDDGGLADHRNRHGQLALVAACSVIVDY